MKPLKKNIALASILAGAFAFAGATQATPMVTLEFPAGSAVFPEGYKATHISYNNGVTSRSINVAAGMFGGVATGATDFDPATLYTSEDNVLAYCIDIMNNLMRTGSYSVQSIGQTQVDTSASGVRRDFGRTLSFLGAVNEVASGTLLTADKEKNWLNPNSSWMSAAIQVGIWERLYEASGTALSTAGGWFSATTLGSEGNQFLDQAFAMMGSVDALDSNQVKWLQSDNGQDLLVDPVSVPVPATLALFGLGLAGLGWSRRGNTGKTR